MYVIGVDYGSDSVRSVIVNTIDGSEVSASVFHYPRWQKGLFCNPGTNQFRQHPLDYIEGIEQTITDCIRKADNTINTADIQAISIDTTGSTPVAVDINGTPLALLPEFENNPNAMFVLWKDHTAIREAAQINAHSEKFPVNYLQYAGSIYSSEWFWSKLLHILRTDESVRNACYSWVEHCDWIPFLLTGGSQVADMKRSRCAAGHKALWSEAFGGLPPEDFFSTLDPLLSGFRARLFEDTYTSDLSAGTLSEEWAARLGLSSSVKVGVGAFDAHMGAVGGQIEPYHLSKVMGTSTCDILIAPATDMEGRLIKGICGQVDGSVIPGMTGLEAGQSGFGDVYAWLKNTLSWPLKNILQQSTLISAETAMALEEEISGQILTELARQADLLPDQADDELASDWFNGRRTPDANQELKGALINLDLGSDAPRLFRALVEATCFGAKSIVDRFIAEGIPVEGIIGIGGVARKSPYIMQMMANVLNMPIRIHQYEHTCARGAAIFAAVVAGIYPDVTAAMKNMGGGFDAHYTPEPARVDHYAARYHNYQSLGTYLENQAGHQ